MARVVGVEPTSSVLETVMLPLITIPAYVEIYGFDPFSYALQAYAFTRLALSPCEVSISIELIPYVLQT